MLQYQRGGSTPKSVLFLLPSSSKPLLIYIEREGCGARDDNYHTGSASLRRPSGGGANSSAWLGRQDP